jgi:hypothetical protein
MSQEHIPWSYPESHISSLRTYISLDREFWVSTPCTSIEFYRRFNPDDPTLHSHCSPKSKCITSIYLSSTLILLLASRLRLGLPSGLFLQFFIIQRLPYSRWFVSYRSKCYTQYPVLRHLQYEFFP